MVDILRSLVFVHKNKVMHEYNKVKDSIDKYELSNNYKVIKMLDYFEKNYLIETNNIFDKLSTVEILLNDIQLSTNVAESFNRTLNFKLKIVHPIVCMLFRILRTIHHASEVDIYVAMETPSAKYNDIYMTLK
ncbi:hypothetical protein DMUE_1814 [Dictyocoela muelleri]|nr:hypothetical protein DMUE_1814 [Dictyocoela muelleri]